MAVVSQFVTTRRASVVRAVTTGVGVPAFAVHGLGGGSYFFEGCAARLADRYRMTAVDLPGTGGSTTAESCSMTGWVADLADVIDRLVGEPVVFVGHSLGTIVGLELWRCHPELIRAMVFVGGLPAPRAPICERLRARAAAIARDGIDGWGRQVAPGVFSARSLAEQPETVVLFARLFDQQPAASYLRCLEILVSADAGDVVSTVTVPCASISGEADAYAPPEDVTAFVQRLPPGTPQFLLPGVGHLPFFEAPDAFAEALADAIGELVV